jgi:SNF2 family DNA or RNA helicase
MFPYQAEALEWMKTREEDQIISGGFLCHEMGLGKTRITSAAILANPMRTLVLTTKSTVGGWLAELRHQSNFAFDCIEYIKNKTTLTPGRPTTVVSTHHSILKTNITWFRDQNFDRLVVDEVHVIRNIGSIFWALREITARIRWGLTATPFNNSRNDIRAYTEFLHPGLPVDEFKNYMLRKRRVDVVDGGPQLLCSKHVYDFESEEELQLYDYVSGRIEDVNNWIAGNAHRLPRHVQGLMKATMILRERQAAIHPQMVLDAEKVWRAQMPAQLGNPDDVMGWDPSKVTKFRHIVKMVQDDQKRGLSTMIVTHFTTELNLLKSSLESKGIHVDVLNGKTKPADRTKLEGHATPTAAGHLGFLLDHAEGRPLPGVIIENILSFIYKPRVLLLQIRAGGVGISLPWVHHVVNTSPDWNPFLELQAIYRAYRINTRHDVRVTSMYFRNTVDTQIQDRQREKFVKSLEWTGDEPGSISEFISMPV